MTKFFLGVCLAAVLGFALGSGFFSKKNEKIKAASGIHPEKEFPVLENKSFVIALFGHNDAVWCERALCSIFSQEYEQFRVVFIDDASRDQTYEKVKSFIMANNQEHRVILMRNEKEMGVDASFQRIAEQFQGGEIVAPLYLSDWLVHSQVLTSLNQAFQNPDVWIVCGKSLAYPSYEFLELPDWKKKVANYEGMRAFYAGLLKQLPGHFAKNFAFIPLLELAKGRVKNVEEPLSFRNRVLMNAAIRPN